MSLSSTGDDPGHHDGDHPLLLARPPSAALEKGITSATLTIAASLHHPHGPLIQFLVERHQTWASAVVRDSATRYFLHNFLAPSSFPLGLAYKGWETKWRRECRSVFLPVVCSGRKRANRGLFYCQKLDLQPWSLRHLPDLPFPPIINKRRAWMTSPFNKACTFQIVSRYFLHFCCCLSLLYLLQA